MLCRCMGYKQAKQIAAAMVLCKTLKSHEAKAALVALV